MTNNKNNTQEIRFRKLLELELCIRKIKEGGSDTDELQNLRCMAKDLIKIYSNGTIDSTKPFSKVLNDACKNTSVKKFSALLVLRILDVQNSLPHNKEDNGIEKSAAYLIESALPEFSLAFKFSENKQTYEKISQMEQTHSTIIENLLPLKHMPQIMSDIVNQKKDIYRAINNKLVRNYLKYYDYSNIQTQVRVLFERAEELLDIKTEEFGIKLNELKTQISNNIEYAKNSLSFLSQDYYLPLLKSFEEATDKLNKDSTVILDCSLSTKYSTSHKAEKKYPLHEVGREVKITIPLVNNGPGIAHDVKADIYCMEEGVAINEELSLGKIRPGEFPFTLNVLVVEPVKEISFAVDLSWNVMGQPKSKEMSFTCNIESQDSSVDWDSMIYTDPYSTEIAEGNEFVGRRQKIAVLAKRLLKTRMQSSYITGQKRIGKTSLALAVVQELKTVDQGKDIEINYIEWGDVAHSDPEKSVEALGDILASFFEKYLPHAETARKVIFTGSIAPLNALAGTLRDQLPDKKFVIILDEFDEIPPEMYRFGPLAEAFFSNLRTLSSKSNIAFMLIGGEKMPFIMGAQGDQLNKFVGEQLDYFSKTNDYEDYIELVKKPTQQMLTWSEGTIDELFHLTNGHPFYTKLICSYIFNSAVSDRDTDVSVRDIKRTVEHIVCQLNVNQFAHHWKDGIQKIEEEESISLDRCRVLVAIGRLMRKNKEIIFENISTAFHSVNLGDHQVKPILEDFCRRGILKEHDNLYNFVVPLFGMWLKQIGVDRLIADKLGDELAASHEAEEEKARVSSSEINKLVKNWPAYRGSEVTSEKVRCWLDQSDSFKDQRLLFTILKNLRYVGEAEIREKLILAHSKVRNITPTHVTTTKRQRRNDIIVTYVDGEGKSGQYYASRYAEENKISTSCLISTVNFSKRVELYENNSNITVNGIVIVDDIIATGDSLSRTVTSFMKDNQDFLDERSIKLVVVALFATKKGIGKVEKVIGSLGIIPPELQIMEPLDDRHYAFTNEPGIWSSKEEYQKAKALCTNIGAKIYDKNPLGFGNMGLLIVFPSTCPNNTLPIIHSSSKDPNLWEPLFPRLVN